MVSKKINRRFKTSIPHQKITTDTSEFKYYKIDENAKTIIKKAYLNPCLDMYNFIETGLSLNKNYTQMIKKMKSIK